MSTPASPMKPKDIKRMEKVIAKEAKGEEKEFQHVVKDLHGTEKSEAKAYKAAHNAEKSLHKVEKKEQSTLKTLHDATHAHDIAVTNLHHAQSDLENKHAQDVKLKQDLQAKINRVDDMSKEKEAHNVEREIKLHQLYSTSD